MKKLIVVGLMAGMALGAAGCKKKSKDIKALCADVFDHAEKDNGKWSAGKGDKAKFTEFCLKQKPDVVRCSSMEIDFGDKSCEKVTGVMSEDHSGFDTKMKLAALRDGNPVPGEAPPPGDTKPAGGGDATKPAEPPAGGAAASPDDEKYQLFTVAGIVTAANPTEMPPAASKVMTKLGIADDKGVPDQAKLTDFNTKYAEWAKTHAEWIAEYTDPGKAKEFYDAHMK